MKVLFFGAGPTGLLYAHLLHAGGRDVTVLARGAKYQLLREKGATLINGYTGEKTVSRIQVVDQLGKVEAYDLVIVLVRKNKIPSVLEALRRGPGAGSILFMGNNALGFDTYLEHLPRERVLFGFPGAGGGWKEGAVHYADREKPKGARIAVRIGEIDGEERARTRQIRSLFEGCGIPVEVIRDMDGWLKYHAAFVIPIVSGLCMHA
jgi:2-dehydropantoate 2-reductase